MGYEPDRYAFVNKNLNEFSKYFIKASPNFFFPSSLYLNLKKSDINVKLMEKLNQNEGKKQAMKNLERIDPLFSGGGCFSIIRGSYIRNFAVQKYIEALVDSGAIWSHRFVFIFLFFLKLINLFFKMLIDHFDLNELIIYFFIHESISYFFII